MVTIAKDAAYRFIELDMLRGFAISIMIFFHLLWDLDYYGIFKLDKEMYGYGSYFPPLFFILVGICLVISSQRKTTKQLLVRGFTVFLMGMIITGITTIFIPERPVTFGALHCIGLSIVFSTVFLRFKVWNILPSSAIMIGGMLIGKYNVQNPTFFHLAIGLHRADLWKTTIDYFPLLPWLGVTLFGVALGNVLYKNGKRQFHFPEISHYKPVKAVSWLGKHSLVIYLLHQPVIIGAIGIFIIF